MVEMTANLPERLGRKITFGVYTIEDLFRGGVFLIVFIGLAVIIGDVGIGIGLTILGLIFFWLFGLVKVDGMDFFAYLHLRIEHISKDPILEVSSLKVYDGGVVYNGRYWFKIIELTSTLLLDFMSDEDRLYVFSQFRHLLNSAPFSMQIIVHSWKVGEGAFDEYIRAEGELAEGYRRLLREHTKDLYLQTYYIIPIATGRDVKGTTEAVRVMNANKVLNIYVNRVMQSLRAMGLDGRVLEKASEIYSAIEEVLSE